MYKFFFIFLFSLNRLVECLLNNNYNIIKLNGKQTIGTHSIKTGPFIFASSQSKILESTADVQDGCTASDKYQPPELKNAAMPMI